MSKNYVAKIDNLVKVRHVLASLSDKRELDWLIPLLVEINQDIRIYSTGGTYDAIAGVLGEKAYKILSQVSSYTGQPEMQGGLVKTLDFRIYLGLLSETYNKSHAEDLNRLKAVPIDMVLVNLYPFRETISRQDTTPEHARANIDIGGPCMVRAAAKNYLRVAVCTQPEDYQTIISELKKNGGCTTLETRYDLARKAFAHTASYDTAIAAYLEETSFEDARRVYSFED